MGTAKKLEDIQSPRIAVWWQTKQYMHTIWLASWKIVHWSWCKALRLSRLLTKLKRWMKCDLSTVQVTGHLVYTAKSLNMCGIHTVLCANKSSVLHVKGHGPYPRLQCQINRSSSSIDAQGNVQNPCIRSKHMLHYPRRLYFAIPIRMLCWFVWIRTKQMLCMFCMQSVAGV